MRIIVFKGLCKSTAALFHNLHNFRYISCVIDTGKNRDEIHLPLLMCQLGQLSVLQQLYMEWLLHFDTLSNPA